MGRWCLSCCFAWLLVAGSAMAQAPEGAPAPEPAPEAPGGPQPPAPAAPAAPEGTPAPEGAPAPEGETVPEAGSAPEAAPEPEPGAAPGAEPGAGPEAAPEAETESESETVPEAETETETEAGAEAEAEAEAEEAEFGAVAVVPTAGPRLSLRKVPRNVQRVDLGALEQQHPIGTHQALDLRLGSVALNDVQNNPLQPDLQYRGFTASPLLGSPQGVAIYQNGVRINEAFGDVVQWDLVPEVAIDEIQLMPGANPLYGLNALGGSLSLRMKHGFSFDGYRVSASAGSFSRHTVSAEVGGSRDDLGYYLALSTFGEEGFRRESRSRAHQLYGDLRHRDERTEVGVNLTLADSDLNGNGLSPVELLEDEGRDAVFTFPDNTDNDLVMVAADLGRTLTDTLSVQATAYVRHLQRDTLNGDEGEFGVCADADGVDVLCDEDDEPLLSERGEMIPTAEPFDGLFNTTETVTDGYGGSLQLTVQEPLAGLDNHFVVGASYDGGHVAFLQRAEAGFLTTDRTVLGQDIFLSGSEFRTKLEADNRYVGVYAADTWTVAEPLALHAAGRFNWANIELDDRDPSGALDGDHDFTRFNPSLGLSYSPLPALTLFASYSESNRAPSASELACADPDEPCRVPNAFVADPPLEQVVNRGVEAGLRGVVGDAKRPQLAWSLAGFGSRNFDDIIFIAGSTVGTGYFQNAGETQRVGLEVDLSGRVGALQYYLGYALVHATFESELELPGGAHPDSEGDDAADADDADADDDDDDEGGSIEVEPGDRVPGIPTHSLKAGLSVSPTPRWTLGVSMIARSGTPFRGDEANLLDDLDGYAIASAHTSYQLLDNLQLFLEAENLLDTEYETFGLLAEPDEVLDGTSDPRFVGPGPPFAIFAGITVHD